MREKGQVGATMGFSAPADGWHKAVVQEGINLKVNEASGKESCYIPLMIESDDEDNGKKVALFVNTRQEDGNPYKSVDKVFANILANLGLEDAFNKKFPGDVSYLDAPVIEAMKIKLPGSSCQIKVTTKDGKTNIVQLDVYGADHSRDAKKAPTAAKASGSGGAAKTDAKLDW